MGNNSKRIARFILPVLLACLLAFTSTIFTGAMNGSATGLEDKNVLFEAEGTNTLLENTTLTEVGEGGSRAVIRRDTLVFGNTGKDTNGNDVPNARNKAEVVNALAGAQSSGKGLIYRFHTWTETVGTNACATAIVFKNPVDAELVTSITLRLYLYLSAGSEFYSVDPFGYAFMYLYGLGDTGVNNSGYVVHRTTKQKEWIDLTISGDNLAKLTTKTEDGGYQFKGLQVGFRARSNDNNKLYMGSPNQLNAFVILDYITYEVNEALAHQKEVTKNGSTLLASSNNADQVVTSNIATVNADLTQSGPSNYGVKNIPSTGAANLTVWKSNFHSGAPTKGLAVKFAKSVALDSIESIVVRMNAHFSPNAPYENGLGGVMFTALETTAVDKDINVHVIDGNVQQDAWIDYVINGTSLANLADKDGNINGIQVASHIVTGDANKFYIGTGGNDVSWLLVDYIYYTPKYQAAFEYEGAAINELATYTTAEKVTLPTFTQNTDEVFVGWKLVDGTNTYLYKAGEQVALTKSVTFSAITVDFDMIKGASIRVAESADDAGIRFACTIDAIDYAALGDFAIEFGTLILPTASLDGKEFIVDNFDLDPAAKQILVIEGMNYDTDTIEGAILYTGVMSKVNPANYARAFSARGYIKINYTNGAGYIYTDYNAENNSRSISEVAKKVKESSVYASYTDGQKAVIDAYADAE